MSGGSYDCNQVEMNIHGTNVVRGEIVYQSEDELNQIIATAIQLMAHLEAEKDGNGISFIMHSLTRTYLNNNWMIIGKFPETTEKLIVSCDENGTSVSWVSSESELHCWKMEYDLFATEEEIA